MKKPLTKTKPAAPAGRHDYAGLISGVRELLEAARRASVRTVNAFMTATYWEVGRRIVEFEQNGSDRAKYGDAVVERLAADITENLGRGFSRRNVFLMRALYLAFPRPLRTPSTAPVLPGGKVQTVSALSGGDAATGMIVQTVSAQFSLAENGQPAGISQTPSRILSLEGLRDLARAFPLPWSHYVLLISRSRSPEAFAFYQTEALRGGWSVRQLQRQMDSQFYERIALSRNKAAMLAKGAKPQPGDALSADEEIRHPLVLEFLGLRDEYSETDLEDALIRHLETFLLELGNDFAFVGRQRRLRIDDEWYRVDLLFFHRKLRCLVIIDLKLGRFTHADAGQMHLYLNYAREHWMQPGENPPVGVILCSGKSEALVHYATDALPNKLLVREYLTALPNEKVLAAELEKTRKHLEARKP
ncbi:MAG: PDDEXK nuclease domain-containing protein [Kiritimatiellia bacterium]